MNELQLPKTVYEEVPLETREEGRPVGMVSLFISGVGARKVEFHDGETLGELVTRLHGCNHGHRHSFIDHCESMYVNEYRAFSDFVLLDDDLVYAGHGTENSHEPIWRDEGRYMHREYLRYDLGLTDPDVYRELMRWLWKREKKAA